jgi:hypothetical protein
MSSARKNPSDVDVALSDLAAPTSPPHSPEQGGAATNGGNGAAPGGSAPLMSGDGPSAAPPDPQGAQQPPPPSGPQEPPQTPPVPDQQGVPAPPPAQQGTPQSAPSNPQAAPQPLWPNQPGSGQQGSGQQGYFQGQPPQPPPGYPAYPGYPGYPQQPGGPYERRGLMQAWYEYPALRWLAVILALAAIALIIWLLAFKDNGSSSATVQPGGGPVGVTQEQLVALSQRLNQPIYWAGNISGTRMELTETSSSYAYLRYLTSDAPVGDSSPGFLTVGTYPQVNAYKNLSSYARNNRANTERIQNGGIAVVIPKSPTSVYFAYPRQDVQIEVYDPQPDKALEMVKSGQIVPVPGGVTTSNGTAALPSIPAGSAATTPVAPTSSTPSTTTAPSVTPTVPGG